MASSSQHAVVEIVEKADATVSYAGNANAAARAIGASEAFRNYSWLRGAPVLNSVNGLRGMVVSARWRTVYEVTGNVGSVLDKVAVVTGLALNIVDAWNEIDPIVQSNDSWDVKAAKLSSQVSSVAIRTVGGVIPAGFGVLATSVQGYCELGGLVSGGRFQPQQCVANLKAANAAVNTTFTKLTDGNNIYTFLNVNITPRVSKWMGY